MNILVLLSKESTKKTSSDAIFLYANAWSEVGHKVTIMLPHKSAKKELVKSPNLKYVFRKTNPLSFRLTTPLWSLLHTEVPFDLIVEQWTDYPFFTPLYSKAKKLVYLENNLTKAKINILQLTKLYQNADFWVVNEAAYDFVISIGIKSENIKLIRNGIVPQKPKVKRQNKLLLFPVKNDLMLEKISEIINGVERRDDGWKYWILSDNIDAGEVGKLLVNSECSGKISIFTNPGLQKKKSLYSQADCVFITDKNAIDYPGVIFTNNQGGLLITIPGAVNDLLSVNENCLMVKQDIVRDGVNIILELSKHPVKFAKIRERCKKFAINFSTKFISKKSVSYLESL